MAKKRKRMGVGLRRARCVLRYVLKSAKKTGALTRARKACGVKGYGKKRRKR